jgi:hypothetical protein
MLPLAEWINSLPLTEYLREIAWFGAIINVMHLLSLCIFAGALLIVDLRLMGGKEYYSSLFWFKMEVMIVAIIFTFVIRPRLVELDESRLRVWGKLAGLASIAMWSGVAIPARLIGLVS